MDPISSEKELYKVCQLLNQPFWLETIEFDRHYRVQADEYDGLLEDTGWLSVAFGANGDVAVVIDRKGVTFCVPGSGGGKSPHVYNALKILAEAIRLDTSEGGE